LDGHAHDAEIDRRRNSGSVLIEEIDVKRLTGQMGRQELRGVVLGHLGDGVFQIGRGELELPGNCGSRRIVNGLLHSGFRIQHPTKIPRQPDHPEKKHDGEGGFDEYITGSAPRFAELWCKDPFWHAPQE